ncbi:hypothetical protein J3A83DRAFT_4359452 [Scleroderma citrinum]
MALLPGQPVPLSRGPVPSLGTGLYSKDGQVRASLVGVPQYEGPVVIRLSPVQATVAISVVDGIPLPAGEEFSGVIRSQDVRATERDKVKIGDCFRGGDVVKGVVVSELDSLDRGDRHERYDRYPLVMPEAYYITTARNDLGVIFATSEAGATMEPISWQEMRCPRTGRVEKRKCAKPST